MNRNDLTHLQEAQESLVRDVEGYGNSVRYHCGYSEYRRNALRRSRAILKDLDNLERSIAELRAISRDVIRVVIAGGVPDDDVVPLPKCRRY